MVARQLALRHGRRVLTATKATLVEVLYPRRCAGCGRRGEWVCHACRGMVPCFVPPWCRRCGEPATRSCRCAELPAGLAALRSAAPFDGWLRLAILAFKYQDEWARAEHLGVLLADLLADLAPIDALVPVPLHPSRLRQRGYNQSALLAHHAGRVAGIPVLDTLTRVRATPQQVRLDAAARQANVDGAFVATANPDPVGLRLVLVDDVVTTGATLGACANALLAAGTARVDAVTLARER